MLYRGSVLCGSARHSSLVPVHLWKPPFPTAAIQLTCSVSATLQGSGLNLKGNGLGSQWSHCLYTQLGFLAGPLLTLSKQLGHHVLTARLGFLCLACQVAICRFQSLCFK